MATPKRNLKRIPKPSADEIKKIKLSLRLRANDPLPKCPAKCGNKAKKLGAPHTDAGHRCNQCDCGHVAGMGTKHYGVGYCVFHENAKAYKGSSEEVAHRQKVALQQGYPDQLYKYKSTDETFKEIREAAEKAQGRHQLREEVVVLRGALQKYIKQIDEKVHQHITDDNVNSLARLTTSIAKLARVELDVTDVDYIHKDEVKSWLYAILRAVQEEITDPEEQKKLLERLVKIPDPTTGRH